MKINNINKEDLNTYRNKGWIKIESFFNSRELSTLRKKTSSFLKKNFKKYSDKDINFARDKFTYKDINSFHKLQDSKYIQKIGQLICKSKLIQSLLNNAKGELRASEYFAKPSKIGLYAPPHQDNFYWNVKNNNALTIWIALNKASKKNGAVYYYDKSHKRGILSHKNSHAKGSSQTVKNIKKIKFFKKSVPELKAGSALIHHTLIVHGSRNNKSDMPRNGVTFQIKDKNAKYDLKKINLYQKKLKAQIKKREIKNYD